MRLHGTETTITLRRRRPQVNNAGIDNASQSEFHVEFWKQLASCIVFDRDQSLITTPDWAFSLRYLVNVIEAKNTSLNLA